MLLRATRRHGFTLGELLLVLVVAAILVAASVPALQSLMDGYNLDGASQNITAQLTVARQTALATSHPVEVRIYQIPSNANASKTVFRAVQCFLDGDTAITPVTKPYFFPATVQVILTNVNGVDVSSLLTPASSGITVVPASSASIAANPLPPPIGTNYTYDSFHFRANGQTDLSSASPTWLLTLVLGNAPLTASGLPHNYATLQFDAITGMTTVYRP